MPYQRGDISAWALRRSACASAAQCTQWRVGYAPTL